MDHKVTFRVTTENLTPLLLRGQEIAYLLNVTVAEEQKPFVTRRRKQHGSRIDGFTSVAVVLNILADGKAHSRQELKAALANHGYSPNSLAPALSALRKQHEIRENENGVFVDRQP